VVGGVSSWKGVAVLAPFAGAALDGVVAPDPEKRYGRTVTETEPLKSGTR
jgi:hypothetical protein